MRFLRLELRDFGSYEHLALDLSAETAVAIVGANGAGKTTILRAIRFALFGLSDADSWIRRDAAECDVSLTVAQEGGPFHVKRGRRRGKHSWLTVGTLAGSEVTALPTRTIAEAQEVIHKRITGMDEGAWLASMFVAQGQIDQFARLDARARKDMLAALLGLGDYELYGERAAVAHQRRCALTEDLQEGAELQDQAVEECSLRLDPDIDARRQEHESAGAELERLEKELDAAFKREQTAAQVAERRRIEGQMKELRERRDVAAAQLARKEILQGQIAQAQEWRQRRGALQAAKERFDSERQQILERNIADRRHEQEKLDALLAKDRQAAQEHSARQARREQLEERLADADEAQNHSADALREAREGLSGLKKRPPERCPECGQTVSSEHHQQLIARHEERVDQLCVEHEEKAARGRELRRQVETHLQGAEQALLAAEGGVGEVGARHRENLARQQEVVRNLDDAVANHRAGAVFPGQAQLDALDSKLGEISRLEGERDALKPEDVAQLKQQWETLKADRDVLPENVSDGPSPQEVRQQISHTRQQQEIAAAAVRRHEQVIHDLEQLKERAREMHARLQESEREQEVTQLLRRAYGRDGIPQMILDSAVETIESAANAVLAQLDYSVRVELRTQRQLKSGAVKEVLDVVVIDGAHEAPLETLSGGEAYRVHFALRCAIADVQSASSHVSCEALCIDEVTDLDREGTLALVEIVQRLGRQTLLVSHSADLIDRMPRRIQVERPAGATSAVEIR